MKEKKAYILGEEVTLKGYSEYVNLPDEEKDYDAAVNFIEQYKVDKVEPVTENKNLDLSLGNGEGGEGGNVLTTNDVDTVAQVINPTTNNGQVVTAPANTPNTTDTTVKITKIPVPFLNSISNQYLSITGEKIPPEFYRQYA